MCLARFVDLIGRTVGVTIDAETAMADYTPSLNARLRKVIVLPGGIAATSLIENGYIKLSCKTFGGVDMYAPFKGIGLETVPRDDKPMCVTECDLQVQAGVPVHVYYYHNVLPVTPEITVFGEFEG